jgi:hypothetical protein
MNTGQPANFTLNLNGHYTPPDGGTYVFGVGAATGTEGAYVNWGVVYVNYQG